MPSRRPFPRLTKKQYAKPEQIIRAQFNETTGDTEFFQVRQVVDSTTSLNSAEDRTDEEDTRTLFDGERHIWLEDAKKLQSEVATGDEIRFPLPQKKHLDGSQLKPQNRQSSTN